MDPYIIILLIVVIYIIFMAVLYTTRYKKVPKDHALVVFKTRPVAKGESGFQVITGGAKLIIPVVEDYRLFPLYQFDIDMSMNNVITSDKKRRLLMEVKTRVRISRDFRELSRAVEHFLDKPESEIREIASKIMEGIIRGVCLQHTYDEIDYETDMVVGKMAEEAERQLGEFGLALSGIQIEDVQIDRHRDRYVLGT